MQELMARHVTRPAASWSESATVQAPQSPSAQPCLAPVRPLARSQSSKVVFGERLATRTGSPLRVKSKEAVTVSPVVGTVSATRGTAVAPLPFSPVCTLPLWPRRPRVATSGPPLCASSLAVGPGW